MPECSSAIVNLALESATGRDYDNHPAAKVNDHIVRISVMSHAKIRVAEDIFFQWGAGDHSDPALLLAAVLLRGEEGCSGACTDGQAQ